MNSKQTEGRNQTDANVYIDRAIAMLKDLPEIRESETVAGYNGVVSLLQYAKESHTASLPSNPVGDVEEMDRVIKFLALELPEPVWNDVNKKWQGFKSGYAAAPQKGMKELFNKLKREFEFVGDEKISGITALRLIKPIFDESPSPSEAGDRRKIVCYCGSLRVALDAFKKAEYEAVLNGEIALLPCCMFVDIEREYGAESDYKQKADEVHKRKIDICDEVFVLNIGGYIGESTRSEIQYAEKIGKPVKYLEPTPQR